MDEQNKDQEEKLEEVSSSEPTETRESMDEEEKSMGGAVGAIIIVAILVIGGIYFINRDTAVAPTGADLTAEEIVAQPDEVVEALGTQGASDEVDDIEADLLLDLGNLEEGLGDIDAELGL